MKLMPGHSLGDLEALADCFPWEPSFLEVALPPFLLGIAKCRGKPAATPPHPPGLLCRGRVFLAPRKQLAGTFWSDGWGRS